MIRTRTGRRTTAQPSKCFFASGNSGIFVFAFSALQLVVAFTESNYDQQAMHQPFRILAEPLLLAVL